MGTSFKYIKMNKYYQILQNILEKGKHSQNKKGNPKFELNV